MNGAQLCCLCQTIQYAAQLPVAPLKRATPDCSNCLFVYCQHVTGSRNARCSLLQVPFALHHCWLLPFMYGIGYNVTYDMHAQIC